MTKKVVAILGTYRKGGITEQTVDAVLNAAERLGAETEKIHLTEKRVEFCTNCRSCTQEDAEKRRGRCVIQDDMEGMLDKIDAADAIVLAAPVNFSNTTAIMKRFIERLIVYTWWPWGKKIPVKRIKRRQKRALLFTSSGAPGLINRIVMPCPMSALKIAAGVLGAKVAGTIYAGFASNEKGQRLSRRDLGRAESAAKRLLG